MRIAMLLALCFAARAQLTLVTCDGTPPATVGSTYSFGSVTIGTIENVHFCAQNNGVSAVTVTLPPTVNGAGFSLAAVNGSIPYIVAPSNFLEFTVSFYVAQSAAATPGTYSASLALTEQPGNSISVVLLATLVAGPTISFEPPCSAGASNTVNFGTLLNGSEHLCNFIILNGTAQPMVISTLAVRGAFQALQSPPTPLTLPPGQATDFAIAITPACGTEQLSGTLTVNATTYALTGQGADPPLPKPAFAIDGTTFASAQQHSLSMSLASPAVCAAKGNVNLAFTPAGKLANDSSIVFLAGSVRSLPFSAAAGSTSVSINGQPSATFQTGTTAGTITFSVSGIPLAGDPTLPITVPPAAITIETAAASNQRTGELDIEIVGFDNTYSAGQMSFTFLDANGKQIGSSASADFTSAFSSYFSTQTAGSSFLVRISFPVTGSASQVATVQATLVNSAGQAQTGTLTFQ